MEKATRAQFLDCLQNSWQQFVTRYYSLPSQEQKSFIDKQGYATFAGLLAHVIAWWQAGVEGVAEMRKNPSLPIPDYDVDAFNAAAVKEFETMSEDEVVQAYESQRRKMVELIETLSEAELNYENVNLRLYYEILAHWREHELN